MRKHTISAILLTVCIAAPALGADFSKFSKMKGKLAPPQAVTKPAVPTAPAAHDEVPPELAQKFADAKAQAAAAGVNERTPAAAPQPPAAKPDTKTEAFMKKFQNTDAPIPALKPKRW